MGAAAAATAGAAEVKIITPRDPRQRGAQLSLYFGTDESCRAAFRALEKRGVIVDLREPNVIRPAPAPLYNTFHDVFLLGRFLRESLLEVGAAGGAATIPAA
eukprot:NODE_21489_length_751_cov_1.517628.p2 GENE.NODE_21489_length_751_cov_1.517628~~NODE_21489_length_751_cov_1.517628.p2  ORF type:complete len:102 (-),score=36.10 NODE_21489_length_751_cov_1.517628:445-750(-)